MAVTADINIALTLFESAVNDLGVASQPHTVAFPGSLHSGKYTSGTTDNKQDLVWSDQRTLAATSEQLDLLGTLTAAIGGATISFVEVRGICIVNRSTTAAENLLAGGGANPAFAGLFGATGDIISIPASGIFLWTAPLDGGGLVPVAGTGDMLTIDAGSDTITYDIVIWGASA